MINNKPKVVLGGFNSGPNYHPDGYNLLMQNGYRPRFSQDTHCPAALQDFPPCGQFNQPPTETTAREHPRARNALATAPTTRVA